MKGGIIMPVFYNYPEKYNKISENLKITCEGKELKSITTPVSAYPINQVWPGYQRPIEQTEPTSFVSLGSNEPITLEITPDKAFPKVTVRPLSKNIEAKVNGNTASITFPGVGQYSVEFDDTHNVVTVFIDPEKEFSVSEDDENVIYFGPGVHYLDKQLQLRDNQTVYVDKNAVVYGGFGASEKKNITICGYGIVDNSLLERGQGSIVNFRKCENVHVEGIVCVDASAWSMHYEGCKNVVVDNIKLAGMWRYNSDGVDFTNATNCILRNSYLRNYDDCIVVKGLCGNTTMPVQNIYAENCVLWCDWGRAIELGAETCAPSFSGIKFKNIDIIHGMSVMMDVQHGDRAEFSNIYFENIRCEYTAKWYASIMQQEIGQVYFNPNENWMPYLFVVATQRTMYSKDDFTGNIRDVFFKDIYVTDEAGRTPASYVKANAPDTHIDGVHFENIVINGKKMESLSELRVDTGERVTNVTIE